MGVTVRAVPMSGCPGVGLASWGVSAGAVCKGASPSSGGISAGASSSGAAASRVSQGRRVISAPSATASRNTGSTMARTRPFFFALAGSDDRASCSPSGVGAITGASLSCLVPHMRQNTAPSSSSAPHWMQNALSGTGSASGGSGRGSAGCSPMGGSSRPAPQRTQKAAPCRSSAPHWVQ